ncbi:hypothetical protein HG535_0A02220 [Zygotorulaspora mrakii]|uniref:histone deacetylase n=1 Tax=Zygotorulaspora mrakii TaxID=42260 RepID=A0A7H9AW26_ZYGMR|nr:uncharacterized protein HG535_0A02220 [Zygotorulaspora mrakii]QLG70284.1 hypothetical protein HG535_0A02220 [Zygotorulaspora mrakii]
MTKLVISASDFQSQVADLLPSNKGTKSQLTLSLIQCYSLLDGFDHVITKPACSKSDLLKFHSLKYVGIILDEKLNKNLPFDNDEEALSGLNDLRAAWNETHYDEPNKARYIFEKKSDLLSYFNEFSLIPTVKSCKSSFGDAFDKIRLDNNASESEDDLDTYNLEGDCPLFSYLPMYCQTVTGASLLLADYIGKSERTVAINWDGGRHHAFKGRASGFCYVNDIVLLIQKLRKKGFQKMSYVDFDLHHGDGVEKAFQFSSNIQTLSLHLFEPGFFPCTGSLEDSKKGKNIFNIPLLHGLNDAFLFSLVNRIIKPLISSHEPEILLIQCGGDGLIGDSFEEWQLSIRGLSECIMNLLTEFKKCSVILLGGGGYNVTVMSRFYTYLTSKILTKYKNDYMKSISLEFSEDALIPEHEFVEQYAEEHYKFWYYELEGSLKRKTLKNDNRIEYITKLENLYRIRIP